MDHWFVVATFLQPKALTRLIRTSKAFGCLNTLRCKVRACLNEPVIVNCVIALIQKGEVDLARKVLTSSKKELTWCQKFWKTCESEKRAVLRMGGSTEREKTDADCLLTAIKFIKSFGEDGIPVPERMVGRRSLSTLHLGHFDVPAVQCTRGPDLAPLDCRDVITCGWCGTQMQTTSEVARHNRTHMSSSLNQ